MANPLTPERIAESRNRLYILVGAVRNETEFWLACLAHDLLRAREEDEKLIAKLLRALGHKSVSTYEIRREAMTEAVERLKGTSSEITNG